MNHCRVCNGSRSVPETHFVIGFREPGGVVAYRMEKLIARGLHGS